MEITLINRTNEDVSVYASLFQKIAKSAEKIGSSNIEMGKKKV